MTQILIFIIGAVVGFLAAWLWLSQKMKEAKKEAGRVEKEIKTEREIWYGFSQFNEKMAGVKKERKGKIMDALKNSGSIKTDGVADLLGVSRATAFRYLEELEKEGVISQIGKTGHEVEYRLR